jgi:selenide,water dikinase
LDFFTPIVDDPFAFGQIAAANSLSDVYAMGGRPICAMNIVCFPAEEMDISILQEVLRGGLQKMHAADVTLVGGHSVEDPELKYGLSVTGIVHPERVLTNRGAQPGDLLILTKPIGTGVLGTAVKGGLAREAAISAFTRSMATLNRQAAELIQDACVHACTDITGFGLIGHLCEMIEDAETGIVIAASSVPLLAGAREYCEMGLLPAGLHRNREFRTAMVDTEPGVPQPLEDLLFDPATSGGLLISLPARDARALLARLHAEGIGAAAVIGEAVAEPRGRVVITP